MDGGVFEENGVHPKRFDESHVVKRKLESSDCIVNDESAAKVVKLKPTEDDTSEPNDQTDPSKEVLEGPENKLNHCDESGKILRSQRPLETMGWYQPHELSGIVPNDVVRAFQHEQTLIRRASRKKRFSNFEGANRKERKMVCLN